jgi:hypothetical protein
LTPDQRKPIRRETVSIEKRRQMTLQGVAMQKTSTVLKYPNNKALASTGQLQVNAICLRIVQERCQKDCLCIVQKERCYKDFTKCILRRDALSPLLNLVMSYHHPFPTSPGKLQVSFSSVPFLYCFCAQRRIREKTAPQLSHLLFRGQQQEG